MTLSQRVAVSAICLACIEGCTTYTDPATGRTVMSTPSIAQLFGGRTGSATAVAPSAYVPTGATMHYEQVLGTTRHKLTLTRRTPTTWLARVEVTQPDCFGDERAIATETAPGQISFDRDLQGSECRIRISENPQTATVSELGCFAGHGNACEFDSQLTRTN